MSSVLGIGGGVTGARCPCIRVGIFLRYSHTWVQQQEGERAFSFAQPCTRFFSRAYQLRTPRRMSEGRAPLEGLLQPHAETNSTEDVSASSAQLLNAEEKFISAGNAAGLGVDEKMEALHNEDLGTMTVQAAPMGAGAALSAHNTAPEVEITLQGGSCLVPITADEQDGIDLKTGVDGMYAWLICFFGCMTCMVLFGILTGFGVMLVPIAEDMGVSPADVSWLPTSINAIMVAVCNFVHAVPNPTFADIHRSEPSLDAWQTV